MAKITDLFKKKNEKDKDIKNTKQNPYAKEEAILSQNGDAQTVGDYMKETAKNDMNEFLNTLKSSTYPPKEAEKNTNEREEDSTKELEEDDLTK